MKQHVKHIILIMLTGLIILTWSCSPKTLAIFFDGVPDPDDTVSVFQEQPAKKTAGYSENLASSKQMTVRHFFHSPYKQDDCSTCHDPRVMGKLQEPVPALCYLCHDDFSTTFSLLHAPAEAGECLICHKPHQSDYRKLLVKPGQELCFDCHDAGEVMNAGQHAEIGDSDCTDCHNPHGGTDRYFLN